MFIIKLLSQYVSVIIMPIITRTRLCTAAYGVLHLFCWLWLCGAGTRTVCTVWKLFSNSNFHTVHTAHVPAPHNHSQHNQCRTPYAAVHTLVLLMMGIMMPKTCWDKSLIINIRLVASCWFLSLHPCVLNIYKKNIRHCTFNMRIVFQTMIWTSTCNQISSSLCLRWGRKNSSHCNILFLLLQLIFRYP